MRTFSLLFILLISFSSLADDKEIKKIRKFVDEANFCTELKDCVILGAVCPIGCNIAVNKSKEKEVQILLKGIENPCEYKCRHSQNLQCIQNKCEVIY